MAAANVVAGRNFDKWIHEICARSETVAVARRAMFIALSIAKACSGIGHCLSSQLRVNIWIPL
jgi:hypothetical protein